MGNDKLSLENVKNTKTAVTCNTKDEWYKVLEILKVDEKLFESRMRYNLNVIPGLTTNTISLGTPIGSILFSLREKKSYYEDNGFTIIEAADFIAANQSAAKPQNDQEINKTPEEVLPVSEPVKEREIKSLWGDWLDKLMNDIPKRKSIIKEILEGANYYTQSEVDAIRKEAFGAGRKRKDLPVGNWLMEYDNFDAYLSSLNLNTNDTGKEDIRDNKINLLEEDLAVVHHYLDDLGMPRKDGVGTLSICGRVKKLEIHYMKKLSEIESEYLSKSAPEQPTNDNAFVLKDFIEKFVGKNTLIRLWYKSGSGHVTVENGVYMEHELVKNKYANKKVLYIKDILVTDSNYKEAINIVIENQFKQSAETLQSEEIPKTATKKQDENTGEVHPDYLLSNLLEKKAVIACDNELEWDTIMKIFKVKTSFPFNDKANCLDLQYFGKRPSIDYSSIPILMAEHENYIIVPAKHFIITNMNLNIQHLNSATFNNKIAIKCHDANQLNDIIMFIASSKTNQRHYGNLLKYKEYLDVFSLEQKSEQEVNDEKYLVYPASWFIEANPAINQKAPAPDPQPAEKENISKTKFLAGHEYILNPVGPGMLRGYVKVKILDVTKICYSYKFQNSPAIIHWDKINNFENNNELVEDVTNPATIFTLEHKEFFDGLGKIFYKILKERKR